MRQSGSGIIRVYNFVTNKKQARMATVCSNAFLTQFFHEGESFDLAPCNYLISSGINCNLFFFFFFFPAFLTSLTLIVFESVVTLSLFLADYDLNHRSIRSAEIVSGSLLVIYLLCRDSFCTI